MPPGLALAVAIGVPCMWLAARTPPSVFRAAAYPLVAVAVLGSLLMVANSRDATGDLVIGSASFQPSELAKLTLQLWGADLLGRKEKLGQLSEWRLMLIPLLPGTAVLCLITMLSDELGDVHADCDLPDAAVGDRSAGPDLRKHDRPDGV
jgi:cell division protein FtsW